MFDDFDDIQCEEYYPDPYEDDEDMLDTQYDQDAILDDDLEDDDDDNRTQ